MALIRFVDEPESGRRDQEELWPTQTQKTHGFSSDSNITDAIHIKKTQAKHTNSGSPRSAQF